MNTTKIACIIMLGKVIDKYGKMYTTISQAKMLELLEKIHKISIKRRALNYHLADLRKLNLIYTIKRKYRREDGTLCLKTSCTYLTADGWEQLARLGWIKAVVFWKRVAEKYKGYVAGAKKKVEEKTEEVTEPDWESGKKWIEKLKETLEMNELEQAHKRAKEILASCKNREGTQYA